MFSEPIVGERFFGREDVLELLNKRVLALKDGYRQNIALTGQSLAGKSSTILHFLHTIKDEGFIPVYVEVIKEPFRSFADKLIATMLYNSLLRMGERPGIELGDILERSAKVLPKTLGALKRIYSSIDRDGLDEAYLSLLTLTSILKDETGFPCIVILDEFDNLEQIGVKNPFLNFGKVIMVQKDTMYIVSSSRNQAIKKIISEKLSLLFGNFEVVKIDNFDLKASTRFIDERLAGFDIDLALKNFLITFTGGNPFYLDKICSRLKAAAELGMSNHIDKGLITEAIVELVYNSSGAIHQYILNFILDLIDTKSKDLYMSILTTIALGSRKQSDITRIVKAKTGEAVAGLSRLSELGLISKSGVFYRIDDSMLEFWLKHVYQRRKALLLDGTFDKMSLFRNDVGVYLDGVVSEFAKGATAKVAELFNLFSNELVQIESKALKLPHFTKVEIKLFKDSTQYIAASFRGSFWIVQVCEEPIGENDVIDYLKNVKALGCKVSNKVMISLAGMDENAKLLAKELKISSWDGQVVNMLLELYGKKGVVMA